MKSKEPLLFVSTVLISLIWFLLGLAPGLTFEDSGELATALVHWGIPHPPGYPFFVILGGLFIRMLQTDVWSSNVFSAVTFSFGLGFVQLIFGLLRDQNGQSFHLFERVVGVAALAILPHLYRQAIITEVYGLFFLLAVMQIYLIIHFLNDQNYILLRSIIFGVLCGLLFATHSLALPLSLLLYLWMVFAFKMLILRVTVWTFFGFILGSLVWLFLPLRAAQEPLLNWGDPQSWQGFWAVVTRAQYEPAFYRSFSVLVEQQRELVIHSLYNWGNYLGLFVILGVVVSLISKTKESLWVLSGLIVMGPLTAAIINFNIPVQQVSYAYYEVSNLTSVFFHVFYFFCGIAFLFSVRFIRTLLAQQKVLVAFLGISLASAVVVRGYGTYSQESKRGDDGAERYLHNVELLVGEQAALILTNWDPFTFPILYAQKVQGRLKNVILLDLELMKAPWYLKDLRRTHLVWSELVGAKEQVYLEEFHQYFQNLDKPISPQIGRSFFELYQQIIEEALNRDFKVYQLNLQQYLPIVAPPSKYIIKSVGFGHQWQTLEASSNWTVLDPELLKLPIKANLMNPDRIHLMWNSYYAISAVELFWGHSYFDDEMKRKWLHWLNQLDVRDPRIQQTIKDIKK